jgi:hypothetical protein
MRRREIITLLGDTVGRNGPRRDRHLVPMPSADYFCNVRFRETEMVTIQLNMSAARTGPAKDWADARRRPR